MIIEYNEPVFRPPSEANSLILQPTIGCSWNKCAFCEMYTSKQFKSRPIDDIILELREIAIFQKAIKKVFLADGNPLCLSTTKLLKLLTAIKENLPEVRRISSYALPSDILRKSDEELKELYEAGLKLLYVGIESGDDELLMLINKGETFKSTVVGLTKAQKAGFQNSVMIINGLGGTFYSSGHAVNTAKVLNEIQPYFVSTLVLSFPYGIEHFRKRFKGEYSEMQIKDLMIEMKILLENLNLKSSIFRSDHASNYLVLKGILEKDKVRLINELNFAIENPLNAGLRAEWMRGL